MGGRTWSPAKFPKEQFTVMDEYTVTVKFRFRWNAEWFQRALKLPWIWFSVPTRAITGEGLFFGVCRGTQCVLHTGFLLSESLSIVLCHLPLYSKQRSLVCRGSLNSWTPQFIWFCSTSRFHWGPIWTFLGFVWLRFWCSCCYFIIFFPSFAF